MVVGYGRWCALVDPVVVVVVVFVVLVATTRVGQARFSSTKNWDDRVDRGDNETEEGKDETVGETAWPKTV